MDIDRRGFFKSLTGLVCGLLGIKALPEKKQKSHWIEREDMDPWIEVDTSMNARNVSHICFYSLPEKRENIGNDCKWHTYTSIEDGKCHCCVFNANGDFINIDTGI
jgi:hypothetical protein